MNISDATKDEIYSREPQSVQNGIPVFSSKDAYIENYEKISRDHISQISETQENPFMEEELWISLEASTRDYIQKYVTKGSRILDVGVGLGRLLEPLTEYKRYGVDISLDYLTIAKRRGIEVALAKIEDLPYQAGFFDAIVICDVLEHVFDLNYCCEKILACLRPGGVLIVRVPFKEDLDVYLKDDLPYEFIHLRNFDQASLRLHFQKIFGLQFLEGAPTTPYLQGTPRLKIRLLPEVVRSKLAQMIVDHPEFVAVSSAMQVSEEAFQSWIYDLKASNKALFKEVASDLILGIGINAVFIKPHSEPESLLALRAGANEGAHITPASQDQTLVGL
jgi:SAM-dependent methyltransferase